MYRQSYFMNCILLIKKTSCDSNLQYSTNHIIIHIQTLLTSKKTLQLWCTEIIIDHSSKGWLVIIERLQYLGNFEPFVSVLTDCIVQKIFFQEIYMCAHCTVGFILKSIESLKKRKLKKILNFRHNFLTLFTWQVCSSAQDYPKQAFSRNQNE